MDDLPTTVAVIWWITLGLAAFVILPLVAFLLHRALQAARRIDENIEKALEAGLGIAGNTANIAALDDTVETATAILGTAGEIEAHTGTIAEVLAGRAQSAPNRGAP